ncbi:MAG: putative iron/ascorbate oxidoreductase [Rhodospirillales bacterium]|nr:putative iron/ascorbate oxidoreductase [Rhodospirillales bacterium]
MQQHGSFDHVPVIDFHGMLHGDTAAKKDNERAFRYACTEVGFFYLTNHGVSEDLTEKAFAAAHGFFALPQAAKMQWHLALSEHACGYVPMRGEDGALHEAFDIVAEDKMIESDFFFGDFRQGGNLWPSSEGLPGFREALTQYSDALRLLTRRLFGAFASTLDLPEDHFAPMTDKPISLLRILHYPSQVNPAADGYIGGSAHTDHECFTILCQDGVAGLQVRNQQREWVSVPRIPNSFVVNIGDQMARWSNDRFASSLHRVINLSGRERYSIPFFVGANGDAVIEALPSCVDEQHPIKYSPIVAGDYVLEQIRKGYGDRTGGGSTIT